MARNLQSSWIRPVDPVVDYDFNGVTRTWELPCESDTECFFGDVLPATWIIGGELYGCTKIVALCNRHAAIYCRQHGVKIPNQLKIY